MVVMIFACLVIFTFVAAGINVVSLSISGKVHCAVVGQCDHPVLVGATRLAE